MNISEETGKKIKGAMAVLKQMCSGRECQPCPMYDLDKKACALEDCPCNWDLSVIDGDKNDPDLQEGGYKE
jgi:hypothetical protein